MTGVDTWAASTQGALVLSENFLYTVEAFEEYLDKQEHFVEIKAKEEAERIRLEEEKKAEEERIAKEKAEIVYQSRLKTLLIYGDLFDHEKLTVDSTEKEFEEILFKTKALKIAKDKQQEEIRIENEKLRKQNEAAEKKRKEQEEKAKQEKDKLEEEKRKIKEQAERKAKEEKERQKAILAKVEREKKEAEQAAKEAKRVQAELEKKKEIECPYCHKTFKV